MIDLLLENGAIITMDAERRIIDGGAVVIDAGRILAVGEAAAVRQLYPRTRRVIDCRRKVILPGLVDSHAHAGRGLTRNLGAGDSDAWMQAAARPMRARVIPISGEQKRRWRA